MVSLAGFVAPNSRAQNDDERQPPNDGGASLAAYIAEMSAELAMLAGRAQLPMLAYFLNLARVEAQIRAARCGGEYEPSHRC
jgi:hypothetical protein